MKVKMRLSKQRGRPGSSSCQRPRTRSSTTIWSLPEELLLHLMKGIHVKDLLSLRSTHPCFRDLIDSHPTVWTHASFQDTWPSQGHLRHFDKAAKEGNQESLIKLGIAYLYNEGLPGDFEGKRIFTNGEQAAAMFCQVESLCTSSEPFTWLFFRPPWSASGACCKQCVFNNMKQYVQQTSAPAVDICIVKTLQLLEQDEESKESEILAHLDSATSQGSATAAFLKWHMKYQHQVVQDKGTEVQSVRELRDIAQSGSLEAQLALCKAYVQGVLGAYTWPQAAATIRDWVQRSTPTNVTHIYSNKELTHSMRFILVDWLVEVAHMKDFESRTLHVAISVVDRYLQRRCVTRSRLQLVGVAAMVLCSRFLGEEIITIREAAWLTDNTYKYEEVVRMMGEITATLRGKFRELTSLDYVEVIGKAADNDHKTQCLSEFMCELALLHSELSTFPQGILAASCVLLARLTQAKEYPWSTRLEEVTGYNLEQIRPCVNAVHDKCFGTKAMVDHRNVTLQAVRLRYEEDYFCNVSSIEVLDSDSLQQMLGVPPSQPADPLPSTTATHGSGPDLVCQLSNSACKDLIASPSRSQAKSMSRAAPLPAAPDRGHASTPPAQILDALPPSPLQLQDDIEDKSFLDFSWSAGNGWSGKREARSLNDSSGYEGDKEDEGESFMDLDGEDSDPDLESLWCTDQAGCLSDDPKSNDESDHDPSEAEGDGDNLWFSPPQTMPLPKSLSMGNISLVAGHGSVPSCSTRSRWRRPQAAGTAVLRVSASPSSVPSSPASSSTSSSAVSCLGKPGSAAATDSTQSSGVSSGFPVYMDPDSAVSTSGPQVGDSGIEAGSSSQPRAAQTHYRRPKTVYACPGSRRQALENLSNVRGMGLRTARPPAKRKNTEQNGNQAKTHVFSLH